MSDLPPHHRFPYGRDESDPDPRPGAPDEDGFVPHHAGDDDDDEQARGGMKTHRETASPDALAETKRVAPDVIAASEQAARSNAGSSPAALAPEPDESELLACRQCGKPWQEPRLSPDGVCPLCQADLDER